MAARKLSAGFHGKCPGCDLRFDIDQRYAWFMKRTPFLPLAGIGPTCLLGIIALIGGYILFESVAESNAKDGLILSALLVLPLMGYLGHCHYKARKLIRSEKGAERKIVLKQLEVVATVRAAKFWNILVTSSFGFGGLTAFGVWGYQGIQWLLNGEPPPMTWLSLGGDNPQSEWLGLQEVLYWLGDTNIGAIALIVGLLVVAIFTSAQNKADLNVRQIRRELSNLKKR